MKDVYLYFAMSMLFNIHRTVDKMATVNPTSLDHFNWAVNYVAQVGFLVAGVMALIRYVSEGQR